MAGELVISVRTCFGSDEIPLSSPQIGLPIVRNESRQRNVARSVRAAVWRKKEVLAQKGKENDRFLSPHFVIERTVQTLTMALPLAPEQLVIEPDQARLHVLADGGEQFDPLLHQPRHPRLGRGSPDPGISAAYEAPSPLRDRTAIISVGWGQAAGQVSPQSLTTRCSVKP